MEDDRNAIIGLGSDGLDSPTRRTRARSRRANPKGTHTKQDQAFNACKACVLQLLDEPATVGQVLRVAVAVGTAGLPREACAVFLVASRI